MGKRLRLVATCLGSVVLACVWIACGSDTTFEQSVGSGGSGATSGNRGSTGNGGNTGSCLEGSSCNVEGSSCTDESCCPCSYTCSNGHWLMAGCANCVPPTCPDTPPTDGTLCSYCGDPIGSLQLRGLRDARRHRRHSPTTRRRQLHVGGRLAGGRRTSVRADPTDAQCPDGQLCVEAEVVVGPTSTVTYSCETNPCSPGATTCDCATVACQQTNAPLCVTADPRVVSCTNGGQ